MAFSQMSILANTCFEVKLNTWEFQRLNSCSLGKLTCFQISPVLSITIVFDLLTGGVTL